VSLLGRSSVGTVTRQIAGVILPGPTKYGLEGGRAAIHQGTAGSSPKLADPQSQKCCVKAQCAKPLGVRGSDLICTGRIILCVVLVLVSHGVGDCQPLVGLFMARVHLAVAVNGLWSYPIVLPEGFARRPAHCLLCRS
jgi:hypothetical protein